MKKDKETPERKRERLRKEELKRNPTGNLGDAFNRASSGNLTDVSWKEMGILILVIIIGFAIAKIFVK